MLKTSFPIACWMAFFTLIETAALGQATPVVVEGCSVFDPESLKLLEDRTIIIRGDRIVAVTAKEKAEIPANAVVFDGRGRFAIPGLIDAHVHLVHVLNFAHVTGDEVLPLYLAFGVTSVRKHDPAARHSRGARPSRSRTRPAAAPRILAALSQTLWLSPRRRAGRPPP
jgi:cytosine/adenosine deaminase-related metal-dependent hydrolase